MSDGEATAVFKSLSKQPTMKDVQDALPVLERFVVLLYDRESQCQSVNDARKVLFAQKGRTLENIPLLRMHYYNMPREWPTKLDIVGDSVWFVFQNCPLLVNGDGQDLNHMCGSLCGPPYLKHQSFARS